MKLASATQTRRFNKMVKDGMSPRLAEMLAAQQAPGCKTEREYFRGRATLAGQFGDDRMGEAHLQSTVKAAQKNGYTPQASDVYEPGLARFPGDPQAFVPASGGTTHIRQVCEERGWSCDGDVKVSGREPENEPGRVAMAEDLVQEVAARRIKENPDLARKPQELREEIIQENV